MTAWLLWMKVRLFVIAPLTKVRFRIRVWSATKGELFTAALPNLRFMVNKDYRLELGLVSPKKTVPRPVAISVLVAVAVTLSWTATILVGEAKKRHPPKAPVEAASPAAVTQ